LAAPPLAAPALGTTSSPRLSGALHPLRAHYAAYVGGMQVLALEGEIALAGGRYRIETSQRTAGLLSFFLSGGNTLRAEGVALAEDATPFTVRPERFLNEGVWRGRRRSVAIEFRPGDPLVRAEPPNGSEREPVPAALQRGTLDTLSAMLFLLRQVAAERGCTGAAPVFDGRRRVDFSVRGEGLETLPPSHYGSYHGPALRCRYEGRQIAGFQTNQAREEAEKPQQGVMWLAPPLPGAPPIPVRVEVESGWLGTAYIHLQRAEWRSVADAGPVAAPEPTRR